MGKSAGKGLLGRPRQRRDGNIKLYFQEIELRTWNGLIYFRIGTSSGLMLTRKWTFLFHNTRGISCLAEELLGSQEGLCCMELIILR